MKKNTATYKSILGFLAIAALIGTPAAVMANSVTLTKNNYSYGDAGEFTANGTGVNPTKLGYSTNTSTSATSRTSATFETFCVETEVAFNPGTSYSYTEGKATGISSEAENDSGKTVSNPQVNLPLSEGTAFLYYEFATGGLVNEASATEDYNYANGPTTAPKKGKNPPYSFSRQNDAGLLQVAIWYFMGELPKGNSSLPSGYIIPDKYTIATDPFVVLVETLLGGGSTPADLAAGYTDARKANGTAGQTDYGVAIMQLTSDLDGTTVANQNQLILTGTGATPPISVPDGGVTLAMLGMGLAGLFFVNFQRIKSVAGQN